MTDKSRNGKDRVSFNEGLEDAPTAPLAERAHRKGISCTGRFFKAVSRYAEKRAGGAALSRQVQEPDPDPS